MILIKSQNLKITILSLPVMPIKQFQTSPININKKANFQKQKQKTRTLAVFEKKLRFRESIQFLTKKNSIFDQEF